MVIYMYYHGAWDDEYDFWYESTNALYSPFNKDGSLIEKSFSHVLTVTSGNTSQQVPDGLLPPTWRL
jgi:hypothetical protein